MRLETVLADAMLAGPWEPEEIRARSAAIFAEEPEWLPALVSEVLDFFHQPPADRPREFAAFVAATVTLAHAHRSDTPMPTPSRWLTSPTVFGSIRRRHECGTKPTGSWSPGSW